MKAATHTSQITALAFIRAALAEQASEARLISEYQGDSVEIEVARTLVARAEVFLTVIRPMFSLEDR